MAAIHGVVVVLISLFFALLVGLLDTVRVEEVASLRRVEFRFVARTGPFMPGIPEAFTTVRDACGESVTMGRGVGVFFDDPHIVAASALRWWIGFERSTAPLSDACRANTSGFEIPPQRAVVASLPYRTFLTPMFGPMRAYGPLKDAVAKRNMPFNAPVELYDADAGRVFYVQLAQTKFEFAKKE